MKTFFQCALLAILAQGSYGFLASRSEQQAHYRIPANKTSIIPLRFIVALHDNHTIEDHYANIGVHIHEVASELTHLEELNIYYFQLATENSTLIHELIRRDPGVKRIGHDYVGHSHAAPIHHVDISDDALQSLDQATNDTSSLGKRWEKLNFKAQWHLAMINSWDRIEMPANFDSENPRAVHDTSWLEDAGKGVNIYIFDSGVRLGLSAFGDQKDKMWHFNSLKDEDKAPYCVDDIMKDREGHGTKVAAVAGGYNTGMLSPAWRANLVSVKVRCDGGGRLSQFITALNDVIKEHKKYSESPPKGWRGSVINISMGFPEWATDPDFVQGWQSVKSAGIPVAAAAGNDGKTYLHAPAKYASTYSVGAVDSEYDRWAGSNHARKLNAFAPGHRVPTIDHITGKPIIGSGTSLACPIVAGIMAMMVGYEGAWNLPSGQDIYDRLDANLVSLVQIDRYMLDVHTPPNLVNTGFNNPNKDWQQHPYAGIPWDNPSDFGPEPWLNKREDNPYANEDGDYRQKNYYDGPARTINFPGAQPTVDYAFSEEDTDEGYFEDKEGTCGCEFR